MTETVPDILPEFPEIEVTGIFYRNNTILFKNVRELNSNNCISLSGANCSVTYI